LHLAALRGNAETVRTLLQLGAEQTNPDKNGRSPFRLALEKRESVSVSLCTTAGR
jgi:ankyrin repeat protein